MSMLDRSVLKPWAADAARSHVVVPSGADDDERLVELWLHGKGDATKEAYRGALAAF